LQTPGASLALHQRSLRKASALWPSYAGAGALPSVVAILMSRPVPATRPVLHAEAAALAAPITWSAGIMSAMPAG
jgi:hypothetical protein